MTPASFEQTLSLPGSLWNTYVHSSINLASEFLEEECAAYCYFQSTMECSFSVHEARICYLGSFLNPNNGAGLGLSSFTGSYSGRINSGSTFNWFFFHLTSELEKAICSFLCSDIRIGESIHFPYLRATLDRKMDPIDIWCTNQYIIHWMWPGLLWKSQSTMSIFLSFWIWLLLRIIRYYSICYFCHRILQSLHKLRSVESSNITKHVSTSGGYRTLGFGKLGIGFVPDRVFSISVGFG